MKLTDLLKKIGVVKVVEPVKEVKEEVLTPTYWRSILPHEYYWIVSLTHFYKASGLRLQKKATDLEKELIRKGCMFKSRRQANIMVKRLEGCCNYEK